jgi:hypothetical protein
MRRRESKKTRRRRKTDPPDGYDPPITEPDLPKIKKIIIRRMRDKSFVPEIEDEDPHEELERINLKMDKIRYTVAVGRYKVSARHSIKEYCV